MSGSTTELGLRTAVDGDDNADYLTIDLKNSLGILDALMNNISGHNHAGAHQGGPLVISTGQLADGSISTAKLADGSVTTPKLADGNVTTIKLADGNVTGPKIGMPLTLTGAALAATAGARQQPFAVVTPTPNASMFHVDFERVVAGSDWTTAAMVLSHDVDDPTDKAGGWISFYHGLVGVNMHPDPATGNVLQVGGGASFTGNLTVWGGVLAFNQAGDTIITRLGADSLRLPSLVAFGNNVNDTYVQRTAADALSVPGQVFIGHANDTYMQRNATNSLQFSGAVGVAGVLYATGGVLSQAGIAIQAYAQYLSWGGTNNTSLYCDASILQFSHPTAFRFFRPGSPGGFVDTTVGQLTNGSSAFVHGSGVYIGTGYGLVVGGNDLHGQSFYVAGGAGGPTGWQTISNEHAKTGVVVIDNALGLVMNPTLHGIHYTLTELPDPTDAYGFQAEPWAAAAPDVVSFDEGGQPHMMDYGQVSAITFEALKQYIAQTDARLAALEAN